VTELTDIDSAAVMRRDPVDNVVEAVDQINGVEFSNLSIDITLSWIEEQHRFRAPSILIQSALDWLISPGMACTLAPYYEDYQPKVSGIEIYSDSDLNDEFISGKDLSGVFTTNEISGDSGNLYHANESSSVLSARKYSLTPAWQEGELVTKPVTPKSHTFTILIAMDDGRVFEKRAPVVLISGI